MPVTNLKSSAPNSNYDDPQNWDNGAPIAGDTVDIFLNPNSGPITANNETIAGQAIQLNNNGKFYTTGNVTFASTTSLIDLQPGGSVDHVVFSGTFTNQGTITNVDAIDVINPETAAPIFVNTGTLAYNMDTSSTSITPYFINGFDASRTTAITVENDGFIKVTSLPGSNQGPNSTQLVTGLQIYALSNGSGEVDITGGTPGRTTAPTPALADQSTVEYRKDVTGTQTFNLNDGALVFDGAAAAASVNFLDAAGILDVADVSGSVTNLTIINGFRAGDAIGIGATNATSAAFNPTSQLVEFFNGATKVGALDITGVSGSSLNGVALTLSSVAPDQQLPLSNHPTQLYLEIAPCFANGTRILTARGSVAVEDVVIGDECVTQSGALRPVAWVGSRQIDASRHPDPEAVLPVRIAAGAFGDNQPARDVWLSPDHAVAFAGALIPARYLADGVAARIDAARPRLTYHHVELDAHDVILADGLPAESFLDTGNKGQFAGASGISLHPDFASRAWDAEGCLPLAVAGPVVEAARARLAAWVRPAVAIAA